MRISFSFLLAACLVCTTGAAVEPDSQSPAPNIVLIVADDMGYSDIGCYGGEIQTPHLDRLAAEGLRFRRFYNNNMCVPTRAALLTSIQPDLSLKKYPTGRRINDRCVTIAEVLKQAGYSTWMSGKWHLCPVGDRSGYPLQQGFDRFFGTILGAGSFFAPASLTRGNEPADEETKAKEFYYTDAVSENAVRFVREASRQEKPFFLYVAYTAPHWPLQAFPEDVAKYKGVYDVGWDVLRKRRHERMKELGVVDPDWPLSPRHPQVPAWEKVENKDWQVRRMEVYAAQIDRMDRGIGRIVDALTAAGRLENTLLMFLSDNGGCHVEYAPTRKGAFLPETTRDGRPLRPGNRPGLMPGPEDTFQSYGYGWANLSNTPFRLYKKFCHEGGIRTPLIVHWPRRMRRGGRITGQVGHVLDILPTCLEAAGVQRPQTFQGQKLLPVEGRSLLPAFHGQEQPQRTLYFQWAQGRAVRAGDWKLVAEKGQPWELYNVLSDGTELQDLSERMPNRRNELRGLFEQWEQRSE